VVALNLSADGAGAAPQLLGNVVLAVPQPAHGGQGDALFRLQLLESSGHLDTLQGGEVLQFKLEPAGVKIQGLTPKLLCCRFRLRRSIEFGFVLFVSLTKQKEYCDVPRVQDHWQS
jgi:hypothetical protein